MSWIGFNDLDSIKKENSQKGPLRALLNSPYSREIDEFYLLYNTARQDEAAVYVEFVKKEYPFKIKSHYCGEMNVADFKQIYYQVMSALKKVEHAYLDEEIDWHFHTSPGTPQMASVWLLLGATRYDARLYQAYNDTVNIVDVPFNIDVEFIDDLRDKSDEKLKQRWLDISPETLISYESVVMKEVMDRALRIAMRNVPAFILGETGTGKEEFAKFIHQNSKRSDRPFVAVNCAAIPENLIESELFGYVKGAFTGADKEKRGVFEIANGGTVFLDEIGDLSLNAQTKILRVLQEYEIQKIGSIKSLKINVRIIAATHKDPVELIYNKKFREDLFHRINIGILKIPPLRSRGEDILLLANHFLDETNREFEKDCSVYEYGSKVFSVKTKKFIKNHSWPGNVRELKNTVVRICMFVDSKRIEVEDFIKNLVVYDNTQTETLRMLDLHTSVDLDEIIDDIRNEYIRKAIAITAGNKTKAAKLLGFSSYQKLDHHLKKIEQK